MPETLVSLTQAGVNTPTFTVSELSSAIKRALEDGFGCVRLRGEVSGFKGAHSSGHCYFGLKDEKAKIEAVIWRSTLQKLAIKPTEGLEVIVTGRVTTFPGSSKYQIVIETLEPAGAGALMALLEERKKKLAAEGLFAAERKRKLPFLPAVVGLVTSPTGAVIRDMLHGFDERFPTRVLLWPVRVQGETCADEVAAAIRGLNALSAEAELTRPDVIIVARGGGSLEDLWGFNEETVVRAAAASAIPLISAVGHETDWTLLDLVADARAPTPTKAAEWAVPKHSDLVEATGKLAIRLLSAIRRTSEARRVHWRAAVRGLPRLEQLLALPRQRLDMCSGRLVQGFLANTRGHAIRQARCATRLNSRLLIQRVERASIRLDGLSRRACEGLVRIAGERRVRFERTAGRLARRAVVERLSQCGERVMALSGRAGRAFASRLTRERRTLDGTAMLLVSLGYRRVLARGYAIVRNAAGLVVRRATAIEIEQALELEFGDGRVSAIARASGAKGSGGGVAPSSRTTDKSSRGSPQGSLF